jgi:hypothetical protein
VRCGKASSAAIAGIGGLRGRVIFESEQELMEAGGLMKVINTQKTKFPADECTKVLASDISSNIMGEAAPQFASKKTRSVSPR